MPVNPPSGGWEVLHQKQGIPVTLPSTVEEYYWGKLQDKPYGPATTVNPVKSQTNGSYVGVSWWWRTFHAPELAPGERLVAHFRGARLRAEVYVNGILCGYSIMNGLPFEADVTRALRPGPNNQLAVRITNPGGHFDWLDVRMIPWGKYKVPGSHGFGGLDAGIRLERRAQLAVVDLAVLNQPESRKVTLLAEVENASEQRVSRALQFTIMDGTKTLWSGESLVEADPGKISQVRLEAHVPDAVLWSLESPKLYRAQVTLAGAPVTDGFAREFGFRWFTAEGIGEDAMFRLNGKRIVLRSAIEWGYWAPNGYWPAPEQVQRSMASAKALGLNCIQAHRHQIYPAVLEAQDRAGLLREWEPGAGYFLWWEKNPKDLDKIGGTSPKGPIDTSGQGGEPRSFMERYMAAKVLMGVKRDRSHPSLILYNLQNETAVWCDNPNIYWIFRRIHELDPSRIITLHSGAHAPKGKSNNEAFLLPYQESIHHDDGSGYAGWYDYHNPGSTGVYVDEIYRGPDAYWWWTDNRKEIMCWGEMGTSGSPDDHQRIVQWYQDHHRNGYDRQVHEQILAAYDNYLDRYGFRKAYPTASRLFQQVGDKHYFIAAKLVEQCRFNDLIDSIVLSGYESTSIDNHSGLLDMHRFPKGNPAILGAACAPNLLAIRPRNLVVAKGASVLVDIHLVNETGKSGRGELRLVATDANNRRVFQKDYPVWLEGGDRFGQLLLAGVSLATHEAGYLSISGVLTFEGKPWVQRTERIYVVDLAATGRSYGAIGVLEKAASIQTALKSLGVGECGPYQAGRNFDTMVLSPDPALPWRAQLDEILKGVKAGARLVIWPEGMESVRELLRELAQRKIVQLHGFVGPCTEPWFGAWHFSRKHPLLAGLPAGGVLDWEYQVSTHQSLGQAGEFDGAMMDAPGLQAIIGYGRDHQAAVGTALARVVYGKGDIVIYTLPRLAGSLADPSGNPNRTARGGLQNDNGYGLHPAVARRLLLNAIDAGTGSR